MRDCHDCGGTGRAFCPACDGRRFAMAGGAVALCAGCGGEGRFRCARCEGDAGSEAASPGGARSAAVAVLFVALGWPALLLVDHALEVLLAYAI